MTQQGDTTSQEPGATHSGHDASLPGAPGAPPEPARPSPYLPEGQAVPEAYPAPPQPGQPRYGAPGGMSRPAMPTGTSQPTGAGQPGYAQPGYGQQGSGYGQAAGGRAGYSPRSAVRDPALAGFGERLLATFLDWILILVIAFLVLMEPLLRVWRELEAVLSSAQYSSQSASQQAVANVLQTPGTMSTLLTYWLLAFGLAFAYFWVLPAIWGATLGKRMLGLRVVVAADRSRVGIRSAGIRAAVFIVGPAILLLVPRIEMLGGLLWVADGLTALIDSGRMQSLHDRAAGTAVIRKKWLDQQAASPARW